MEKGGKLKVTVNKKDENGVSGYEGIRVSLYAVLERERSDEKDYCTVFNRELTNELGQVIRDSLIPGLTYGVSIDKEEFPDFDEKVIIKKGQIVEITHQYDYTNNTGISGSITYSDKKLIMSEIMLVNFSKMKSITTLSIERRSQYTFRDLEAGNYMLYIYIAYKNEEMIRKDIPVVVEKNEMSILNLNL